MDEKSWINMYHFISIKSSCMKNFSLFPRCEDIWIILGNAWTEPSMSNTSGRFWMSIQTDTSIHFQFANFWNCIFNLKVKK